ncbi:MAG: YIP1 family protein [Candidatus Binatia bacterium]
MATEEFNPNDPVGSFTSTWQRVMLDPRSFFTELPAAGGLQAPFLFALICLGIGGVSFLIFGGGIKGLLCFTVLGVFRLFLGSAIVALIAQHLFEGKGDYESTFRALAYSSAAVVVIGVPLVKYFAALYTAYVTIVGLANAHSFDNGRALLTVLTTAIVGIVLTTAFGLWDVAHRCNPLLQ